MKKRKERKPASQRQKKKIKVTRIKKRFPSTKNKIIVHYKLSSFIGLIIN